MNVQLALNLDAPSVSTLLGDPLLNRAFVQASRVRDEHYRACTKGCQLEPPDRCDKGHAFRQAAYDAYKAVMATAEPSVIAGIRARVESWAACQRKRGDLWWNNLEPSS